MKAAEQQRSLGKVLYSSGILTILLSVAIGAIVTPWAFLGVVLGVFDLVLALMFSIGKLGYGTRAGADATGVEVPEPAEPDLSENPYARED